MRVERIERDNAVRPRVDAQAGSALIWALVFVIITSAIVVSHSTFLAARRGERDARYVRGSMADTFAQSGLQDALGWFHGRSDQPIVAFDPVHQPDGLPPRVETIDPTIGLVREFEINGSLWGRYEVRHEDVRDVSPERGELVPGSAWDVGVRGYVYRRRDPSLPFDQSPNELVGTKAITSELRWLQINPPATAAVCIDHAADAEIGPHSTISGGAGSALASLSASSGSTALEGLLADIDGLAVVDGYPATLELSSYEAEAERVFAMRLDELLSYSDVVLRPKGRNDQVRWHDFAKASGVKRGNRGRSDPSPTDEVVEIENKLLFVSGLELGGALDTDNTLLVVDGDLTSTDAQRTKMRGVVYVTGNADLDAGVFALEGALIVRGKLKMGTSSGSSVSLRYDEQVISRLRKTVGKYRKQRSSDER